MDMQRVYTGKLIREFWDKSTWLNNIQEWRQIINHRQECIECKSVDATFTCKCGTTFCNPKWINFPAEVCVFCDVCIEPMICNPINLDFYLQYCPYAEEFRDSVFVEEFQNTFNL